MGVMYLDMLQQWQMPQLLEDKAEFVYKKMGLPFVFLETSVITLMLKFLVVGLNVLLEMTIPSFVASTLT